MNNQGVDGVTINESSSQLTSTQLLTPGLTVEEHQANHIHSAVHDALAATPDLNENENTGRKQFGRVRQYRHQRQ